MQSINLEGIVKTKGAPDEVPVSPYHKKLLIQHWSIEWKRLLLLVILLGYR